MSYMEQAMQTQIDGAIALENQICDEACEVYKEVHLTPRQLLQQRADLLEALKKCRFDSLNMSIDTWREIQETIQRIDQ